MRGASEFPAQLKTVAENIASAQQRKEKQITVGMQLNEKSATQPPCSAEPRGPAHPRATESARSRKSMPVTSNRTLSQLRNQRPCAASTCSTPM